MGGRVPRRQVPIYQPQILLNLVSSRSIRNSVTQEWRNLRHGIADPLRHTRQLGQQRAPPVIEAQDKSQVIVSA